MIAISPVLVNTMYDKHFFVVSKCECISLANTVRYDIHGYGRPTVVSNIVVSKCECISLAKTVTLMVMYGYVMCAISMENSMGDQ